MPKDRGAERGDVDGSLECNLALGMVAAETRGRVAAQQALSSLPWIGVDDLSETKRLPAGHTAKMQIISYFQLGGPEKLTGADDPRHALQKMDAWRTYGTWWHPWLPGPGAVQPARILMTTITKLERNETCRKRRSCTTWTT